MATPGTNFLRSVIETSQPALIRRVREEFFTEEELPAFLYLRGHLETYSSLPTLDVMSEEGHPLAPLRRDAGAPYYLDTLRKRFAYTKVNDNHPQLVECMRNRDIPGMLQTLRGMVQEAASAVEADRYSTLADEAQRVHQEYLHAKANPGLRGISFGWDSLDLATNGAIGGDLIVMVGRPSMGKSWLMMEMAHAAWRAGNVVAVTSMEMGLMQITRRWIGRQTRTNPNLIRAGELSTYAEERFVNTIQSLGDYAPVHLLAGDMRKQVGGIENMIVEFDPAIVFVDAAYLLSPSAKKRGFISKWESISEVVNELKCLALRYDKPIVITVQFNRNQKTKSSKELDLGDIAGSDSIPQDASIVIGARMGPAPYQDRQRILELMKNRDGPVCTFATNFTFTPVNFDEIPLVTDGSPQEQVVDSAWMV